ncbi:helix-turn-helix transcriptional regulator [Bacillus thuringiensis]|uniref:helix-turn-helix domain-containing protein n=1 Tax=Bacillus thuringiensis TaxID=1428 RepID=UPI00273A77D6|nr:helix-turn-helix transcriptional regulator [Bacillus thuringiensis]WLP61930.1 helix-turn-helix transcriptional regulator [Bacillus thuringiensis]
MITSRILSLILEISALTQHDFAEKIEISQTSLSRYTNGEREIPHEVAARITETIGKHNLFLLQTFNSGLETVGADIKERMKGRD